MNEYLINTLLGLIIRPADTAEDAWAGWITGIQDLNTIIYTQKELIERGYKTIESTQFNNVFKLIK